MRSGIIDSMQNQTVTIIPRNDGRRRVIIEERPDGLFQFVEQSRHDLPLQVPCEGPRERWATLSSYGTICDSAITAEREARNAVEWLRLPETPPSTGV